MTLRSPRLTVGAFVAVSIMGITASVLPFSLSWVNQARQERDAVDQRVASLKGVLELLVDAETGERGYVISGKEAFLQPYHTALSAIPLQFERLKQGYSDVPQAERQMVLELIEAAQRRLVGLSEIVQLRQAGGFAAAEPLVTSGHGKTEMEQVRRLTSQLGAIEVAELASLNGALEKKIVWSIATSLASTLLTFLLLAYLAQLMLRAVRAGQVAAEQAQSTSAQLAHGMEALKRRNDEVSTLGEMSRLLQTEMSLVEALEVTGIFAGRLLPQTSGSVYLFRNSADTLELAATWGCDASAAAVLQPRECWGIRRSHVHRYFQLGDLRCHHYGEPIHSEVEQHTCLPLMANGDVMGLMHVFGHGEAAEEAVATADMARAISEQAALALSNAKLRQVLRDQSIRDPLTGWYNRRHMEETMARELLGAQRNRTSLSVLIADLDHFKQVNDAHGHSAGDAVLRAATRHMATMLRGIDVACRFGGEEFLIILPECGKHVAIKKAQQLCDAVRALTVRESGQAIMITASFGVSCSPEDGMDAASLIKVADSALYQAKQLGRDRVMF